MNTEHNPNPLALAKGLGLNRRQFLAATTGMAAAAAVSSVPLAASASAAPAANGVVVPPGKRGIILYTVRDAISRDPSTTPYASGFKAVFEELGRIGYKQVEFAGAPGWTTTAWRRRATTEASRRPSPTPRCRSSTPRARSPTSWGWVTSARAVTRRAVPTSPTGPPPRSGGTSWVRVPRGTD